MQIMYIHTCHKFKKAQENLLMAHDKCVDP